MSLETNVCSNCGYALKQDDDFCSQCGKVFNPLKIQSLSKFKSIFIISFLFSVIYPIGGYIISTTVFPLFNSYNGVSNTYLIINGFLTLTEIIYYTIILVMVYIFCKIAYNSLNKYNIKKFLLYEFIITGLGSVIGMLIGSYILPIFIAPLATSVTLTLLPIYTIIVFLIGGLTTTPVFIMGLLLQKLSVGTSKYTNYPKTRVIIFSFALGISLTLVFTLSNYFLSNNIINYLGTISLSNFSSILTIVLNFTSLMRVVIEILVIFIFVTRYSIYLEEKSIFQDSFVNYIAIAIGSIVGSIFYLLVYDLFTNNNLLSSLTDLTVIGNSIVNSLYFALPVCILFISIMLLNKKGLLSIKQV